MCFTIRTAYKYVYIYTDNTVTNIKEKQGTVQRQGSLQSGPKRMMRRNLRVPCITKEHEEK